MRGVIFAIPLSLALWAVIYGIAHCAIPAPERHAFVAQAYDDLAVARHDMHRMLVPRAS
ncbi:hypothetical protein [Novosphingobium terrae]|uniref:hypothetical protein n=1 Tax=Novosphingobium terrae TaxID=2726189 RepID=UPI00197FF732|nr:hypothetical protein [Novosphingobium terrae]